MSGEILFFEYIAAIFLGLSGIAIIMMCLMHGDNKKAKAFKSMRLFMLFSFLLGANFFTFYYREVILRIDDMGSLGRAADYFVAITFNFVWMHLVFTMLDSFKHKKLYLYTKLIFVLDIIIEGGMAVFIFDTKYSIPDTLLRNISIFGHCFFTLTTIVLMSIYMVNGIKELVSNHSRIFVGINSILVMLLEATGLIFAIEYMYGVYPYSVWDAKVFDPTGILLILVNVITIYFVYKADFSPLFKIPEIEMIDLHDEIYKEAVIEHSKNDLTVAIDVVAQEHHLTVREREILLLAYNGYTNPNIAEKLGISLNTAKRHMHNIFEKLDVNTRVELVHLINSQI